MKKLDSSLITMFTTVTLFSLILFQTIAFADSAKIVSPTMDLDRINLVKRAVVHLECATNTLSYDEQNRQSEELKAKLERKEISSDQFKIEQGLLGARGRRNFGTGVFIVHENLRYLLTARHVLEDVSGGPLKIKSDDYIYDYIQSALT